MTAEAAPALQPEMDDAEFWWRAIVTEVMHACGCEEVTIARSILTRDIRDTAIGIVDESTKDLTFRIVNRPPELPYANRRAFSEWVWKQEEKQT